MIVLCDTNVLIDQLAGGARGEVARARLAALRRNGHSVVLVPQILAEFFVVCTKPKTSNGLGLEADAATAAIRYLMAQLQLVYDDASTVNAWLALVAGGVKGKRAHDARIAAFAVAGKVDAVLTSNVSDFTPFGIRLA